MNYDVRVTIVAHYWVALVSADDEFRRRIGPGAVLALANVRFWHVCYAIGCGTNALGFAI